MQLSRGQTVKTVLGGKDHTKITVGQIEVHVLSNYRDVLRGQKS